MPLVVTGQQVRRRRVLRLARQSAGVVVIILSCLAGLMTVSHRVLSDRVSVSRVLAEASSSSDSDSCGELASWETSGGIVLYIMVLGYIFVALAIICDDYFVPALEKISHKLTLSPDVAGATFMAAGSSAPELFVSLADNVFKKPAASLGIGTIVGSAIFNVLIIISLSGLLAGQVLKLDWRPLLRDSLWYTWSISVLAFAVQDGSVDVLDSLIMVCSYVSYIGYMSFNDRVIAHCCKHAEVDETQEQEEDKLTIVSVPTPDATSTADVIMSTKEAQSSTNEEGLPDSDHKFVGEHCKMSPLLYFKSGMLQLQHLLHHVQSSDQLVNTEVSSSSEKVKAQGQMNDMSAAGVDKEPLRSYFVDVLVPPAGIPAIVWFVFTWPIVALARITIPDCRHPVFSGTLGFSATFVVSIFWIGVLSHYTVTFGSRFGCIAGIPSTLMGLTIIAAGTSIPDALSSIFVARDGHGDMAISNAFGSNVFDILFGLGFPFLLSNFIYGEAVLVSGDDLNISIVILFVVLLFVVMVLVSSRWRLYPLVCAFLLLLYVAYVAFSYLRGLNII